MKLKKILFKCLLLSIIFLPVLSDEEINKEDYKEHEFNVYSGMFDFSDDGQRAALIGFQHQNELLQRESFLGTLSPITGFILTENNASYFYTGVQTQYKIGKINVS